MIIIIFLKKNVPHLKSSQKRSKFFQRFFVNFFDIKRQEIVILFKSSPSAQTFSRCLVWVSEHLPLRHCTAFLFAFRDDEGEKRFVLLEICCAISIHKILEDPFLEGANHDIPSRVIFTMFNLLSLRQMMQKVNIDDDVSINS